MQTKDMMTATPALYRDLVLFADYKGIVQAVGASDGKARWTYDAQLPVAGDLVVDADRVFVGSRTYDLIALDAANGKELWKHYYWFSWIESPPVVRDGVVYTGSSDGVGVFAIDARDGKLRWKAAVPGWAWPRTAVGEGAGGRRNRGAGRVSRSRAPARSSGSIARAVRSAGCTSSRRARRRWRRRRSGASRPRPRWPTASSMQRTCRAASTPSSAMHTACGG